MKAIFSCAAAFLTLATVTSADAKGCLKGAVVGGTAGHFAGHHGILGAAAGCVIGRHEAEKRARMQDNQNSSRRGEPLADAFVYWVRWRPPGGSDCQRAATIRRSANRGRRDLSHFLKRPIRHSASLSIGHSLQMSHGTRRPYSAAASNRGCGPPRQGSQGVIQTPADTPDLMRSSGPLTTGSA